MFDVPGLLYIPDYLAPALHDELVDLIDAQPWSMELARRTQHYGYKYDYAARSVDPHADVVAIPAWLAALGEMLHADQLIDEAPDQVIVNEYEPGQGIGHHLDCVPCFTGVIFSLSLLSGTVMQFRSIDRKRIVPLYAEPRSLIVMRGAARYEWTHGIPSRAADLWNGEERPRGRRISITYRKVKFNQVDEENAP